MSIKPLITKGTKEYPNIILDAEKGVFTFSGKSLPEDATVFFTPIFDWIDEYEKNPNDSTVVVFKMFYYNTSSAKAILDILEKFSDIANENCHVSVKWYYLDIDEDMEKSGMGYADLLSIPFDIIPYSLDDK